MNATKTRKKAPAPVVIENLRTGHVTCHAEVIPGVSIRLYGVEDKSVPDGHRAYCGYPHKYSPDQAVRDLAEKIAAWVGTLAGDVCREIGRLLHAMAQTEAPACIVEDAIEEAGGERKWLGMLSAVPVTRTVEEAFSRTFHVGDQAEYHSYNLTYFGEILAISAKTVRIKERHERKTYLLKLDQFAWKNHDFDLAKAQKRNSEWSD